MDKCELGALSRQIMRRSGVIAITIVVAMVASILSLVTAPQQADAANAAQFDPGMIISDTLFYDGGSMTASSVQAFLNAKVPNCSAGYTCLKSYSQATASKAAVAGKCSAYAGAASESAATIIAKVGVACGISQQVLLVLLEKEQGLVRSTAPSAGAFRSATGFGCPDTAACDSTYYGFFNQVYMAAKQFKTYATSPGSFGYVAGRVNQIRFSPTATCGSSAVFIQNQATAGLYNYTPYQPDPAALKNLYGTGDACSAYGNRNFWVLFTDWFGSTTSTTLMRTAGNVTVYLVANGVKYPVPNQAILTALSPLGGVSYVSQPYLDSFPVGQQVGRIVRSSTGTIYFIDSGIKLPFGSCSQVVDYGGSCNSGGFVQLSDAQIAAFVTGPLVGPVLGTVDGGRYYISAGIKHEILDDQSQAAAGLPAGYNVLTEAAIAQLPLGAPLTRDSVFIRQRGTNSYVYLGGGKRYTMTDADAASIGASSRAAGTLQAASLNMIPAAAVPFSGSVVVQGSTVPSMLTTTGRYTLANPALSAALAPVTISQGLFSSYVDKGAVADGTLLMGSTGGTVYVVMGATLRPISSWSAALALSPTATPSITTVSSAVIASLPMGAVALTAGSLYRTADNPTVYLINGVTSRIAFSNFIFPAQAGFTGFQYTTADRLNAYQQDSTLLTFGLTCGTTQYVSVGGSARSITPAQKSLFPFTFVSLDQFTCRQLKVGAAATTFIRTSSGSIYQLVAGQKRPIDSMARYNQLSGGAAYMQVADEFAAFIPTGPLA
jgi:hypothetical protein